MKTNPSAGCASRRPVTRTSLLLALSLLSLAFLPAGCGRHVSTAEATPIAGLYRLVVVDGTQIPAKVVHDRVQLEVRSGSMDIRADGTCVSKTTFVPPSGGEVHREVTATYTLVGSKLTLRWRGAGRTIGTVEGDTFTMNNEGMIFTYRK